MKFWFCDTCGKRLNEQDLALGRGRDKKLKGVFCDSCAIGVSTVDVMPIRDDAAAHAILTEDKKCASDIVPVKNRTKSGELASSKRNARQRSSRKAKGEPPSLNNNAPGPQMLYTVGAIAAVVVTLLVVIVLSSDNGPQPTRSAQQNNLEKISPETRTPNTQLAPPTERPIMKPARADRPKKNPVSTQRTPNPTPVPSPLPDSREPKTTQLTEKRLPPASDKDKDEPKPESPKPASLNTLTLQTPPPKGPFQSVETTVKVKPRNEHPEWLEAQAQLAAIQKLHDKKDWDGCGKALESWILETKAQDFVTIHEAEIEALRRTLASKLNPGATYLADLKEIEVQVGHRAFSKRTIAWGAESKMIVNGTVIANGLFMHPPSRGKAFATYRLAGPYKKFKAGCGINQSSIKFGSQIRFAVYADGKELWSSKLLERLDQTDSCDLDISGVEELMIAVECLGSFVDAHAVWIDPRIISTSDAAKGSDTIDATTGKE